MLWKKDRKVAQATLLQSLQDKDPLETPAAASASSSERLPPASARAPGETESVDKSAGAPSEEETVDNPARAPSEGKSKGNKGAIRQLARKLGVKQRGRSKEEVDRRNKDATSGQQTLDSVWEKLSWQGKA